MASFGPFSVDAAKINALGGTYFGAFINRLLTMEIARAGMAGSTLEITYIQNLGDGGVDAGLRRAQATRWIPEGDSAWQLKAGDLTPADCKAELRGAGEALAILRAGGKYRLVLGASRTAKMIAARRKALRDEAVALSIHVDDDTFEVFTADTLATWAEDHPALAVDPILGGIGTSSMTFEDWTQAVPSTRTIWATSDERDKIIGVLRDAITTGTQRDLRVEGVSGVGKTRLVLEALRGQLYESLVVYVPAADQFHAPLLKHLASDGRTAIVVIDECDRKQHEVLTSALVAGSTTTLITIGEPTSTVLRSSAITLPGMDDNAMESLLALNAGELSYEARRVVIEVAAGNVDYALQAADAIGRNPTSAGSYITVDDVKTFIVDEFPKGNLFVASMALALFSRFGHDGEVAVELTTIAEGLGVPETDLRLAARELDSNSLMSRQGRYRSVGPFPVAVYLAKAGWDHFGGRIVSDLMPTLGAEILERLFRRAADIGEFDIAVSAVSSMLPLGGTLAGLAATGGTRVLLSHFAVIAPVEVSDRLGALLDNATDADLREHDAVRRDIVWALGKLAWHSDTFERAATSLLRLALVETEQFSNNASGSWVDLFGTFLPSTAAAPAQRIAYLAAVAESDDSQKRLLAARAATHALDLYGTILVSGELQGGRVVEPRGTATFAEAAPYMSAAIDLLRNLAEDPDGAVAGAALKALIESMPRLLDFEPVRRHLGSALGTLPSAGLRAVRAEVASMRSLYDESAEARSRRLLIDEIDQALPHASATDELWVLAHSNAWSLEEDALLEKLKKIAGKLNDPAQALMDLIVMPEPLGAAFDVGRALAGLGDDELLPKIEKVIDTPNFPVLVGFLIGRVAAGDADAFDRFIDGAELTDDQALSVTVSGVHSARADARVESLIGGVSVAKGARALLSWAREYGESEIARYVRAWTPRIETKDDYDAVLNFVSLHMRRLGEDLPELDDLLFPLVARRKDFPDIPRHHYRWDKLAVRAAKKFPVEVVRLFADLIEANGLGILGDSAERQALEACVRLGGPAAWLLLMDRIEGGAWRVRMFTEGWLADSTEISVVRDWVGASVERARLVAAAASVGDTEIAPIARYLLQDFGSDEKVISALSSQFSSGGWSGKESEHIALQLDQLNTWISRDGESAAVKGWGRKLLLSLQGEKKRAAEREAEELW
ncbi:hypothetical protein ASC66_11505 [Leifsonia sp. Root4]|uniref:hypothetical protein n=1 Tax=Leifsonia sp. Root4 TaxID=1736525 RepID=UPI000700F4B2|nr:hypothetical protein [Leifsonia sp. Root4]KQW05600.1 hypothetical protein ASC66_11505 [Leifsonia sp. Root4]